MPLAALALIGWTGYKEIWKWGTDYKKLEARCEKLQVQVDRLVELAFKNAALAEKSLNSETMKQDKSEK